MHHLLGDERAGYICYSERSWYEGISRLCKDKSLNIDFSEKAYELMKSFYNPDVWCERFIWELKYWLRNEN